MTPEGQEEEIRARGDRSRPPHDRPAFQLEARYYIRLGTVKLSGLRQHFINEIFSNARAVYLTSASHLWRYVWAGNAGTDDR